MKINVAGMFDSHEMLVDEYTQSDMIEVCDVSSETNFGNFQKNCMSYMVNINVKKRLLTRG